MKQYFDEANVAFCTMDREWFGKEYKVQFPQAVIVEWGKDDWGWKAELSNQLELKFNSKYQMIGIDD